jgi:UDP-N-acetylglucosamine acyltransferase
MIHPTAVVHPRAKVHATTRIGPYAVVDAEVTLGPECELGPARLYHWSDGDWCEEPVSCRCVIGDAPQDLKYKGELTGLRLATATCFVRL